MAWKVFLSFLGTSNYQVSKYYVVNTENFVETRFVQIASCKFHCWDFDENDEVLILQMKRVKHVISKMITNLTNLDRVSKTKLEKPLE